MSSQIFDLAPFNLQRPEHVVWRFDQKLPTALENIQSKSLRSFLSKTDQVLAEQHIEYVYQPVDRETFAKWLNFYRAQMESNEYDVLANLDWYDHRIQNGRVIEGVFFYRDGEMVGSGIITKTGSEKATLALKASQRIDISNHKNASLGAMIDYLFLNEMVKQQIPIISGGKSRNAFGVINTLGYVEYKMRFGFKPFLPPQTPQVSTVQLNEEGYVVFFTENDQHQPQAYFIRPTNAPELAAKLEPLLHGIPNLETIEY